MTLLYQNEAAQVRKSSPGPVGSQFLVEPDVHVAHPQVDIANTHYLAQSQAPSAPGVALRQPSCNEGVFFPGQAHEVVAQPVEDEWVVHVVPHSIPGRLRADATRLHESRCGHSE